MHVTTYQPPVWAQTLWAALSGSVLGAALQLQQVALWPATAYGAIVVLGAVLCAGAAPRSIVNAPASWRRWLRMQGLVGLGCLLLGLASTGLRAHSFEAKALDPALEGQDVVVTAVVAGLPQRNEAALRFRVQVESATLNGTAVQVPPRIDVGWYGGAFPAGPTAAAGAESIASAPVLTALNRAPPLVGAGERWQLTLRLKAPHGARNPHGFDYELWLWEQGVQATAYVRAGPKDTPPERLGATWWYPVSQLRQAVRDAVLARLENRQQAGMIAALVVGDQASIDRADWDVFRATGVAHLVSISGLHITMLAWAASHLTAWLWRRSVRLCMALPAPTAALWGGVGVALAYSAFAGWGVPAQRTCLMLVVVSGLRAAGVRWPWPLVWMLACAVVVAWDPWALLQSGFWLSFVAVGVLFATNSGAAPAHSTASNAPLARNARGLAMHLGRFVLPLWREQWVVTVALAPLTLLLFGQMSLVGLLANVLAVPWVTLVVTPLALAGAVLAPIWDAAAWAVGALMAVLQTMASWPLATLQVAVAPLGVAVLAIVGALVVVAPLPWALRIWGIPLVVPVLLWQAPVPPAGEFELLAADVGQGNAVLVRTAGHALMFDAGPRFSVESDAGHRVLVPLMQALQTRLDAVVLSHRDIDHVGGAPAVLAMQPQAELSSSIEADHPLQAMRPAHRCEEGQSWTWDGVSFEVLHPHASDYDRPVKPNALSCVLRISNGSQTALLTGDIEQPQEAWLVQGPRAAKVKADVLLVPHHGSNTSSSAAFLDAVAPRIAIVQSGYRNRFGHPTRLVTERYAGRQIAVVDSPHCGAYTWQSWRPDATLSGACWRLSSQRYWHHRVP